MTPFARIAAVIAILAMPFTLVGWYRSHAHPQQHRFDLTLTKSVWVYMQNGRVAFDVLSLPTKTPSRSEFRAPILGAYTPIKSSFDWKYTRIDPYRRWVLVFPMWVPNATLFALVGLGVASGPLRSWLRRRSGRCVPCGYDLRGSRSGRCPECGTILDRSFRSFP